MLQSLFDEAAKGSAKRPSWVRAKKIERFYVRQLRKVARHVADIVGAFSPDDLTSAFQVRDLLRRYAEILIPWAQAVAGRMIADTARSDAESWRERSERIGKGVNQELRATPKGERIRALMAEQVDLITSLPRDAAERIHELAMEGLGTGARAADISADIMKTGAVTKSRADLIARTEVGRASTTMTRVRAESVGSVEFIWRTAGDSDVRPMHRALNGKAFRWDEPPECDPGHRALPGSIWNCRCYAEPVLPEP